ncbi:MAG: hypothetical protein SF187_07085 [Deltaproteobacteria bacterium]|nr:hypothetical protein [Deltaproteobacteria bacterium]
MDDERSVAVSPRHKVVLARELLVLLERAPRTDFVVRTLAKREANGLPLMTAEMVVAGEETRRQHPAAATYPLHFRKTYFPGRLHGDPGEEYKSHLRASELCPAVPAPIGYGDNVFRSCLIPGRPYARLTPFGADPPESNIALAAKHGLAEMAGLWHFAEDMFTQLRALHTGGLAHGDAELHNCIVCPAPLESLLIDFESAVEKSTLSDTAWETRCALDLEPLLREAVYLQCGLGHQPGPLGDLALARLDQLFRSPDKFRRAIEVQAAV